MEKIYSRRTCSIGYNVIFTTLVKISRDNLLSALPIEPTESFWKLISAFPVELSPLSEKDRDKCILQIFDYLSLDTISRAGSHRQKEWTDGWLSNYHQYKLTNSPDSLVPGYYNKYPWLRFNSQFYKTNSAEDELNTVRILLHYIADIYFGKYDHIVELGAGSCHHLHQLACHHSAEKHYYALDWNDATPLIAQDLRSNGHVKNINALKFDFFAPFWDSNLPMPPFSNTAIYSFAALEQVGDKYQKLVDFVINDLRPDLVVHLEPISELLPKDELLPALSSAYFQKRNYLSGYLDYLRSLQSSGKICIVKESRMPFGSLFIEGYSLVVWKPCT